MDQSRNKRRWLSPSQGSFRAIERNPDHHEYQSQRRGDYGRLRSDRELARGERNEIGTHERAQGAPLGLGVPDYSGLRGPDAKPRLFSLEKANRPPRLRTGTQALRRTGRMENRPGAPAQENRREQPLPGVQVDESANWSRTITCPITRSPLRMKW